MKRALYLLPVLVFAAVVGYFILALDPNRDPHLLPSAMIDKPAPAFELAGFAGKPGLALGEITGHVVLVNFFASWCLPCRAEHALLMQMAKDGLPLYGIDYKDKQIDGMNFLQQFGDPFRRIGLDSEGRTGIDFGVYGVPETYVIDKQGRIRLRHVGPLTEEDLKQELLPLLRELERS
jgi:cytochrome c biogenesis protein CcmG/thiol:disulfide interchange protein DsbE